MYNHTGTPDFKANPVQIDQLFMKSNKRLIIKDCRNKNLQAKMILIMAAMKKLEKEERSFRIRFKLLL